ncbi:MAG: hypothetical protein CMN01_03030 [Rickettsiales bacterium]|nr:hypothetical protein [Rickettsiales bacterium]|tara:strand:+ start:177 stop:416 length:240 start_codon:yes stop_codon:yes gene_type:complete
MKRRLDKSLKRLKKEKKVSEKDDFQSNKLNPYEIKIFRNLRDKYNLSINKNSKDYEDKDIQENILITLERIKKGEKFKP